MNKSRTKSKKEESNIPVVKTERKVKSQNLIYYDFFGENDLALYKNLRNSVPIIDAAILKIIRLIGGFKLLTESKKAQALLDDFYMNIAVGGAGLGLESFVTAYLSDLLTYGNAIGEIVFNKSKTKILNLYNANILNFDIKKGSKPLDVNLCLKTDENKQVSINLNNNIFFTALNPDSSEVKGNSLLKGLPFISEVLMKIYNSVGQNFDRIGNIRYAVTYKPTTDSVDRAFSKDRAKQIAAEWSKGMTDAKNGNITDFICLGDVDIKVIGADNQLIDTNVPVRQMLEQIVAKLSIPPFLLGLSWSTTERMSKQQCDILTSELEYYRRLVTPTILKICKTYLMINDISEEVRLEWDIINLLDETEHSKSRLYSAQADKIIAEIGGHCEQ